MGPWRFGGLGLRKEQQLREESCFLNPTHWYADVRVDSRTALPIPPLYTDPILPTTCDDMQRRIQN